MSKTVDVIEAPLEVDLFGVGLSEQVEYTVSVFGALNAGGTLAEPVLVILDSAGEEIGTIDDSPSLDFDSQFKFTAPTTDVYYLAVADFTGGVGDYTIEIDSAEPPTFITSTSLSEETLL
jgi:hypothetical protein